MLLSWVWLFVLVLVLVLVLGFLVRVGSWMSHVVAVSPLGLEQTARFSDSSGSSSRAGSTEFGARPRRFGRDGKGRKQLLHLNASALGAHYFFSTFEDDFLELGVALVAPVLKNWHNGIILQRSAIPGRLRGAEMSLRLDGFRPEFLDFQRGIRVGHLEPHERITQILKLSLEERYRQTFVTDRWGRGVYWQWICFLPKANRLAKPVSSRVNFGCAKYFIMIDREEARFKAGLQIERGFVKSEQYPGCQLCDDWDWNRLVAGLKGGGPIFKELRRLTGEDFEIQAGSWEAPSRYSQADFPSPSKLIGVLNGMPADRWGGFQVFYPMTAEEVRVSTGPDLVEAMLAVFEEVTPAMNECMQIRLATSTDKQGQARTSTD